MHMKQAILLPKFTTCVRDPMQQVWPSCHKVSWEFSSCFLVQCLFIDLPAVNLWILPIFLLDCMGMVCGLLQEKGIVHHLDTPLVWKCFPKWQWKWNAVYTSVADCSWTWNGSCMKPTVASNKFRGAAEGKSSAFCHQHFTISILPSAFYHQHFESAWWDTKNRTLSIWLTSSRKNPQEQFLTCFKDTKNRSLPCSPLQ